MKYYSLFLVILLTSYNALSSNNSKKLIYEGNEEFIASNYIQAINKYTEALKLDPSSEIADFNLATALVTLGTATNDTVKINFAEKKLNSLSRSNSKSISNKSNFDLGNIAYNKGDYKASIEFYKKVLRVNPSDDLARKYLRMAQLKLQSKEEDQKENQEKEKEQNNEDNNNNEQQKDENKQDKQEQQDQKENQNNTDNQQQSGNNQSNAANLLKSIEEKEQQTLMKINALKKEAIRREHEANRANTDKPW